eukprot:1141024-Pelagomonas_calceolata.AAC.2
MEPIARKAPFTASAIEFSMSIAPKKVNPEMCAPHIICKQGRHEHGLQKVIQKCGPFTAFASKFSTGFTPKG